MTSHPLPTDPRHQRFADLVLQGKSLVDAYTGAGFKPASKGSAKSAAARLRKQPEVIAYIESIQSAAADESVMSVLEIRQFLARIKRTPISELDPDSGDNADLIKSYSKTESEMSNSYRLEKLDPLKAIEIDLRLSGQDPELNHLKLIADAITAMGEGPIPSDRMPE